MALAGSRGGRAAMKIRSRNEKNPAICRALRKWRDPDSNRGHHDFQSGTIRSLISAICRDFRDAVPLRLPVVSSGFVWVVALSDASGPKLALVVAPRIACRPGADPPFPAGSHAVPARVWPGPRAPRSPHSCARPMARRDPLRLTRGVDEVLVDARPVEVGAADGLGDLLGRGPVDVLVVDRHVPAGVQLDEVRVGSRPDQIRAPQ
jgi:hypothetical protein